MGAVATKLMTVAEFRQLPEPADGQVYELQAGEIVRMTRPTFRHHWRQDRFRQLLSPLLSPSGYITIELAFRARPEHELRAADVGFVRAERAAAIDPDDNLQGAPDLTIEILSPANTAAEMYDREQLCLANGCAEFWTVNEAGQKIRVATSDGPARTYSRGDRIPLDRFAPEASLAVDDLFAGPGGTLVS